MIFKVNRPKGHYGIVTAEIMQNDALSSDARFLLAMVATLSPDWKFYMSWVRKRANWGKEKLQKVMRELEGAGYLSRRRIMPSRENGQDAISWEYDFYLEPGFQALENQGTEKPFNNPRSTDYGSGPNREKCSVKVKGMRERSTTTELGRVAGGRSLSFVKEERRDSELVTALLDFLVTHCADELAHDSPMAIRTARCLATRATSFAEFTRLYEPLMAWIACKGLSLADIRREFGIVDSSL